MPNLTLLMKPTSRRSIHLARQKGWTRRRSLRGMLRWHPLSWSITDCTQRFPKLSTLTTSAKERRLRARTHPVPPRTRGKNPALTQSCRTTPMLSTRNTRTTCTTTLGQNNSLRTTILTEVSTPFTGTGVMTSLRFPKATLHIRPQRHGIIPASTCFLPGRHQAGSQQTSKFSFLTFLRVILVPLVLWGPHMPWQDAAKQPKPAGSTHPMAGRPGSTLALAARC
jgi:hypothetical protein